MGNSNTKESRPDGYDDGRNGDHPVHITRELAREANGRSRHRSSRAELNIFGLGGGSSSRDRDRQDAPFEHRETRQEREARKLERERAARAKERERSIREENVDGGYLVTMGTYTGTEDFGKPVVRQLMVLSTFTSDTTQANRSRLSGSWLRSGEASTTGHPAGTNTNS